MRCLVFVGLMLFANLALAQENGELVVTSNVVGASIVLNGQTTEYSTPTYISDLDTGIYVIELIDAYGKRVQDEVEVVANKVKTIKLNFDLTRLKIMSNLEVDSVYVNGALVGVPIRAELSATINKLAKGDYSIKIVDRTYGIEIEEKVFLTADSDSVYIDARLGNLTVEANEKNALIYLNGQATEQIAPATFADLPAGVYIVLLKKKFKTAEKTVLVRPNLNNTVIVKFEKSNLWKYITAGVGLIGTSTLTYLLTREEKDHEPIGNIPGFE
ncbi:MAG: PEGA domain-containing protein [Planctomycetes bacterium]|nr:PEGA domain-containing protein [Planctomycetota bacterium]